VRGRALGARRLSETFFGDIGDRHGLSFGSRAPLAGPRARVERRGNGARGGLGSMKSPTSDIDARGNVIQLPEGLNPR